MPKPPKGNKILSDILKGLAKQRAAADATRVKNSRVRQHDMSLGQFTRAIGRPDRATVTPQPSFDDIWRELRMREAREAYVRDVVSQAREEAAHPEFYQRPKTGAEWAAFLPASWAKR